MEFQISNTHINPVWLIATGFIVGLFGGFFGVGGSFLAGPALFGFGVPMNFVVGTDLAHIVGKSIVAARKHGKLGNIDLKLAGFMVIGTIAGVESGAQVIQWLKKTSHIDIVVGISFIVLLLAISTFMGWECWKTIQMQRAQKRAGEDSGKSSPKHDVSAFKYIAKKSSNSVCRRTSACRFQVSNGFRSGRSFWFRLSADFLAVFWAAARVTSACPPWFICWACPLM